MNAGLFPTFGLGKRTATADTAYQLVVPRRAGKKTKITNLVITVAGTAHTFTFLRPLNKTTTSAAAAASQAVINLTADPGVYTGKTTANNPIAASDVVVIQYPDGVLQYNTVSSVSTLAITLATNLIAALPAGSTIYFFGVAADTDPQTGSAHPTLTPPTGATTTYSPASGSVIFQSVVDGDPIVISNPNATAASSIDWCAGVFGP